MAATNDIELEHGTFEQSSFSSVPKASKNGIDLGNGVDNSTKKKAPLHGLVYGIEDMPPWYTTFILGLQVRLYTVKPATGSTLFECISCGIGRPRYINFGFTLTPMCLALFNSVFSRVL